MTDKPLAGKTIAVMLANGFDEIEFTEPQKRLIEAGATVKVVSRANGLVNGWYDNSWGHFFPVDADLSTTLAVDYDGLVVPGGHRSVEKMSDDPHSQRILKAFVRADMPVLMVGDAVAMLTGVEMAGGRTVSTSESGVEALSAAGATLADAAFAVDGALVTASSPDGLEEAVSAFSANVSAYEREVVEAA